MPQLARLPGVRVLMYSHDSWGLGHLRRSLAIAGALIEDRGDIEVLVVSGSPCATQFELPDHCDVLKLPAVSKDAAGRYVPRQLPGNIAQTIALRRRLIFEAYQAYDPHLIIIDHQLTGLLGEALDMIRQAHASKRTLIYGLRDVLDSASVVEDSWSDRDHGWALSEAYDRICIYGDPVVFDPTSHYSPLHSLGHKIEFSGYVSPPIVTSPRRPIPAMRKQVVVTMGGGQDGAERIEAYLDALSLAPAEWDSHVVLGPLMADEQARRLQRLIFARGLSAQVELSRFHRNMSRILQSADAAVCMAGYNTCAEIMRNRVPAVLMPRTQPRKEQWIRAHRLQDLGVAHCLERLDPSELRSQLERVLGSGLTNARYPRLDGLSGVCRIVWQAMEEKQLALQSASKPQRDATAR